MPKKSYLLKALIFDMDGVITNTMPDHYRVWHQVLHEVGVPVTHLDIYKREGQQGLQSVKEIFADYGRPYDEKLALRLLKRKEKIFKKIVKQRFITGARRWVRDLHRQGFKLAVVTGTARHEMFQILPAPIRQLFDIIVTGTDVKRGKPHPEPYQAAIKKLGVSRKDALVIENAPVGIASAKAAGIACVAIETSLPRGYLKEADAVFESIRALRRGLIIRHRSNHEV